MPPTITPRDYFAAIVINSLPGFSPLVSPEINFDPLAMNITSDGAQIHFGNHIRLKQRPESFSSSPWVKYAYCPVTGNLLESSFSTQFSLVRAFIPRQDHRSFLCFLVSATQS